MARNNVDINKKKVVFIDLVTIYYRRESLHEQDRQEVVTKSEIAMRRALDIFLFIMKPYLLKAWKAFKRTEEQGKDNRNHKVYLTEIT